MNGFGFLEYEDPMDARDVVPGTLLSFNNARSVLTKYSFSYVSLPSLLSMSTSLPNVDGTEIKGERLTVQFARGPRRKDDHGPQDRQVPRPRRTIYRMQITGLQSDTSWQVRYTIHGALPPC